MRLFKAHFLTNQGNAGRVVQKSREHRIGAHPCQEPSWDPVFQSVIKVARIVESILIEDERVGECADFQKPVPIRGVARPARSILAG